MADSFCSKGLTGLGVLVLSWILIPRMVAGEIAVIDLETNYTQAFFPDKPASFGPDFDDKPLGRVVFEMKHLACKPIHPAPPKIDDYCWIALIQRGQCTFTDKVLNAQNAGFCAAIIYNFDQQQDLTKMGGDNDQIVIPSTFVGYDSGRQLGLSYSFPHRNFVVKFEVDPQPDYQLYLWPFAIVAGMCLLSVILFAVVRLIRVHSNTRASRLSRKHLKKIPIRKFKKGQYYDTCAICLDEYEDGEKVRVLPCDHAYHAKCIDPWLTENKKTCPVCKRRVIPGADADGEGSDSEDGDRGASATTPLLLNQGQRSHGSLNHAGSDVGPVVVRAQSAPASILDAAVVIEVQGATGGADLEHTVSQTGGETVVYAEEDHKVERRKKKRKSDSAKDNERLVAGAEYDEDASKAEHRERRKKKKEKKRKEEKRAKRNVSGDSAGSGGVSAHGLAVHVEPRPSAARDEEGTAITIPPFEPIGSGAEAIGEVSQSGHTSHTNPNFFVESEEVTVTGQGKKQEMNELV